jgi:hypothetical protein
VIFADEVEVEALGKMRPGSFREQASESIIRLLAITPLR